MSAYYSKIKPLWENWFTLRYVNNLHKKIQQKVLELLNEITWWTKFEKVFQTYLLWPYRLKTENIFFQLDTQEYRQEVKETYGEDMKVIVKFRGLIILSLHI